MADAALPAARRLLDLPTPALDANPTERLDAGDGKESDGDKQ
jgi:hypothetical protein